MLQAVTSAYYMALLLEDVIEHLEENSYITDKALVKFKNKVDKYSDANLSYLSELVKSNYLEDWYSIQSEFPEDCLARRGAYQWLLRGLPVEYACRTSALRLEECRLREALRGRKKATSLLYIFEEYVREREEQIAQLRDEIATAKALMNRP